MKIHKTVEGRHANKCYVWAGNHETTGVGAPNYNCPEHGRHDPIDASDLTFEHKDTKWKAKIKEGKDTLYWSYCPECIEEYRKKDPDLKGKNDLEVIGAILKEKWYSGNKFVEPAHVDEIGDFEYCPFCGEEFEDVLKNRVTCEKHGPMELKVLQNPSR